MGRGHRTGEISSRGCAGSVADGGFDNYRRKKEEDKWQFLQVRALRL